MARVYKSGEWSKSGRVKPGKRTAAKSIDQLLPDGTILKTDSDQIYSRNELREIIRSLFPDAADDAKGFLEADALSESGSKVRFYLRNIYHLGGDWSSEKKRIQISKDFHEFHSRNIAEEARSLLVGCYHYQAAAGADGVTLFVCFSPETYAARKANNSAAHIHTVDLLNAQKTVFTAASILREMNSWCLTASGLFRM